MNKQRVSIYLDGLEIVGDIYLQSPKQRITDVLNEGTDKFLPLTEVRVFDNKSNLINEEEFICVNKDMICLVRKA